MSATSLVSAAVLAAAAPAEDACRPPAGFANPPPPAVAPMQRLVSRTERATLDGSLVEVIRQAEATSLADTVTSEGSLPGIRGDFPLTPGPFDRPGARRLVCLTDGSTLSEQILELESSPTRRVFTYVVWNYSTAQARPIHYGVGRFVHTQRPDGRTDVAWTYGFQLRRDRFPGFLGPVGRWLFRVGFLDRAYARMMRETLAGEQRRLHASRAEAFTAVQVDAGSSSGSAPLAPH